MTARDLLDLLAAKHRADVYFEEVKDGPTQSVSHYLRLDAWAFPRSWHLTFLAYEVKVSRADFMRDNKFLQYLPLCHRLYLVTPHGLLARDEVPPDVGHLEASKNGKRLFTRKVAPRHEPEPQALLSLMTYLLMARTTPQREVPDNLARFRAFLERKAENRRVGWEVRRAVREAFERLEFKVDAAESRLRAMEEIRRLVQELGINPDSWGAVNEVRKLLARATGPDRELEAIAGTLEQGARALRRLAVKPEVRDDSESVPVPGATVALGDQLAHHLDASADARDLPDPGLPGQPVQAGAGDGLPEAS